MLIRFSRHRLFVSIPHRRLRPSCEGVAMFGDEGFDRQRRPPANPFDEVVGPSENAVGVVEGHLPQMLDQEFAPPRTSHPGGLASYAVCLRIERSRIIAWRSSGRGARDHVRPLLDG